MNISFRIFTFLLRLGCCAFGCSVTVGGGVVCCNGMLFVTTATELMMLLVAWFAGTGTNPMRGNSFCIRLCAV